jgi:hypothetical protein
VSFLPPDLHCGRRKNRNFLLARGEGWGGAKTRKKRRVVSPDTEKGVVPLLALLQAQGLPVRGGNTQAQLPAVRSVQHLTQDAVPALLQGGGSGILVDR